MNMLPSDLSDPPGSHDALEVHLAGPGPDRLAALVHEWRTPLNAISAASEVLRMLGGEPAQMSCDIIRRQTRVLTDQLEDLLRMAELGRSAPPAARPVALHQVVRDLALHAVEPEAEAGREGLPKLELVQAWTLADQAELSLAVERLLQAAARLARGAGPLCLRTRVEGGHALLEIAPLDWRAAAPGTPAPSTAQGEGATRFMLAEALLARHGGHLALARSGSGWRHQARWPLAQPPSPNVPDPDLPQAERQSERQSAFALLIVHAHPATAAAWQSALEHAGQRVGTCTDPALALGQLLDLRPERVLVALPPEAALPLARAARAAGYAGLLIAVGSEADGLSPSAVLRAGFDALLAAPLQPDALPASLATVHRPS